jgi:uncharacterized protein YraI
MNLRKGPGTSYAKVGTLPGGTTVKVFQKSGNWYKIYYHKQYCWASGDYLKVSLYPVSTPSPSPSKTSPSVSPSVQPSPSVSSAPQPSATSSDGSIGTAKCTAVNSMNIRSGPGTSYAKIGTLPGGTTVKVFQKSGNWYKIFYNGKYGWCSGDYLSVTLSSGTAANNSKVTISHRSSILSVGDTLHLSASSSGGTIVSWVSSKESIASVDKNGTVKALAAGTAVITVTDSEGEFAQCSVTVNSGVCIPNSVPVITGNVYSKMTMLSKQYEDDITNYVNTLNKNKKRDRILMAAFRFAGIPYSSADCSSVSKYVYGTEGYSFSRTSAGQANQFSTYETDIDSIAPGDLVFFKNLEGERCSCGKTCTRFRQIHHVAIYAGCINGNHYFIEASSVIGKCVVRMWDHSSFHADMQIEMAVSIL